MTDIGPELGATIRLCGFFFAVALAVLATQLPDIIAAMRRRN
jgi:hypothetical protein